MSESTGRRSVNAHTTPFLPYDMEGPVQPGMSWLPLSYDEATGQGTYLMRMEPGAVTIAHDHAGMEEFLVLQGDLVDSDGKIFGPRRFRELRGGHAPQLVDADRLPHRRLRVAATRLKRSVARADSDNDSRLGTDGNQPCLELREGAADDAALLFP
jgi:hypothetical protein